MRLVARDSEHCSGPGLPLRGLASSLVGMLYRHPVQPFNIPSVAMRNKNTYLGRCKKNPFFTITFHIYPRVLWAIESLLLSFCACFCAFESCFIPRHPTQIRDTTSPPKTGLLRTNLCNLIFCSFAAVYLPF